MVTNEIILFILSFSEPNNISNECLINKLQFGVVFNAVMQITFSKNKFKVITKNLYVNKLGKKFKFNIRDNTKYFAQLY